MQRDPEHRENHDVGQVADLDRKEAQNGPHEHQDDQHNPDREDHQILDYPEASERASPDDVRQSLTHAAISAPVSSKSPGR